MFTNVYFTNLSPLFKNFKIIFFQKNTLNSEKYLATIFNSIQECQHGWSHSFRILWDLNFRLIKSNGSTTSTYALKPVNCLTKSKYILSKEGKVSFNQNFLNGHQIINFEQIKGNAFIGVQIYRGHFLVAQEYFNKKQTQLQLNTIISVLNQSLNQKMASSALENQSISSLDFDFIGIKNIYLSVENNKKNNLVNQLKVQKIESW